MLREIRELFSFHGKLTPQMARHDVHNVAGKAMRDLQQFGFEGIGGKRMLDLGCGQRFAFALQCAAAGAKVTALDLDYVKPHFLPVALFHIAKHNGVKRALKSMVRRIMWDSQYYRELEENAGKPLRPYMSKINFVVADPTGGGYPLPSSSFDLIASNAVLEHVSDLEKFAQEVARLLDTGGYFYAVIHNFFSLSGGHNLDWTRPDENPPSAVPPWDHIRENRFPVWVRLNRCKPEDYTTAFSQGLRILRFEGVGINHDAGELEGEKLLTPEIAAELAEYPRELLLTRAWVMICKKE